MKRRRVDYVDFVVVVVSLLHECVLRFGPVGVVSLFYEYL